MHVDAAALTAAGGVLARQQAHLEATRRYVDLVCDRPGALVGVLAVFRGTYTDAVAAGTRGLADAARLAHDLERAVCAFRDDVLEVDTGSAARLARTERMLHGPDPGPAPGPGPGPGPGPAPGPGPGPAGAAVGLDGAGATGGVGGVLAGASAGPASASLGGPRPSTGLARVLSAQAVAEVAESGWGPAQVAAPAGTSGGDGGGDRDGALGAPSPGRSTLEAARGLHEQVGDLRDTVRGVGAGLGEAGHGLADLDSYAAFTTGATDSAAELAARLGAPT